MAPTTTDVDALGFAKLFTREVLRHHGVPLSIVSDRDPRFTGKFWSAVCVMLGTQQNLSTAFHPQSDGQTERMNRVIEDMLRHYVSPTQTDWDDLLPLVEFAINSAWQQSVRQTPFVLNYGYQPRTPMSVAAGTQPIVRTDVLEGSDAADLPVFLECKVPAAVKFTQEMRAALSAAKEALSRAQQRQKAYADRGRTDVLFAIGDDVLLSTKNIRFAFGVKKLLPKWIGPFKVAKQVNEVACELDLPSNMKLHDVFHVSLLKPYLDDGRTPPPIPGVLLEGQDEWEVERVLLHRDVKRGRQVRREYLIKWKGYAPEHNSWEVEADLANALELLQEYLTTVHRLTVGVPKRAKKRARH